MSVIKGYRQLTPDEIGVINKVKEYEALGLKIINDIERAIDHQLDTAGDEEEEKRLRRATPHRWAAIGRTHLQQATMSLVRAVAQPGE